MGAYVAIFALSAIPVGYGMRRDGDIPGLPEAVPEQIRSMLDLYYVSDGSVWPTTDDPRA